jgi:hypothetical protein
MLSYTRLTFYDEFSIFWLRFFPQLWLILHLMDPDPGNQTNADPNPKHFLSYFTNFSRGNVPLSLHFTLISFTNTTRVQLYCIIVRRCFFFLYRWCLSRWWRQCWWTWWSPGPSSTRWGTTSSSAAGSWSTTSRTTRNILHQLENCSWIPYIDNWKVW